MLMLSFYTSPCSDNCMQLLTTTTHQKKEIKNEKKEEWSENMGLMDQI